MDLFLETSVLHAAEFLLAGKAIRPRKKQIWQKPKEKKFKECFFSSFRSHDGPRSIMTNLLIACPPTNAAVLLYYGLIWTGIKIILTVTYLRTSSVCIKCFCKHLNASVRVAAPKRLSADLGVVMRWCEITVNEKIQKIKQVHHF